MYFSRPDPLSVKIVTSSVRSDHKLLIISDGDKIINLFKKTTPILFRPRSPALNASFLSNASSISAYFSPIYLSTSTISCSHQFSTLLTDLLNNHFPQKKITLSDNDPPFITPEIKMLLRKKNALLHQNKLEQASALAIKTGKIIALMNSKRLNFSNTKNPAKLVWDEVHRLTKSKPNPPLPPSLQLYLTSTTQLSPPIPSE
jgi:hypothetical protein